MNIRKALSALGLLSLATFSSTAFATTTCTPVNGSSTWPGGQFTQVCSSTAGTNTSPITGQQMYDTLKKIVDDNSDPVARLKGVTVTATDQLSITISNSNIPIDREEKITYTIQSGDHLSQAAKGLADAINSNADLQTAGISASNGGANVYIYGPPGPSAPATTWTTETSIGATETMEVFASGVQLGGTAGTSDPFVTFYLFYTPVDGNELDNPGGSLMLNAWGQTNFADGSSYVAQSLNGGANPHNNTPNVTAHELGHWIDYVYPATGVMKTTDARIEIHNVLNPFDQVTLTVANPSLPGPSHSVTVSYIATGAPDWYEIAVGLANAVNANTTLSSIGITAAGDTFDGGLGRVWIYDDSKQLSVYSTSATGTLQATVVPGNEAHQTKIWRDALKMDWLLITNWPPCGYYGRWGGDWDYHAGLFSNRKDPSGTYFCDDNNNPNITNVPVDGGGPALDGIYSRLSNQEVMRLAWPSFFRGGISPFSEDQESAEIWSELWAIQFGFTDWKFKGPANIGSVSPIYVDRNFQLIDSIFDIRQFPCTRQIIYALSATGDPTAWGPGGAYYEVPGPGPQAGTVWVDCPAF